MTEDKEKQETAPADAKPHLYKFKEFGGTDGPYCQPVSADKPTSCTILNTEKRDALFFVRNSDSRTYIF
jgi:hypothetical protein